MDFKMPKLSLRIPSKFSAPNDVYVKLIGKGVSSKDFAQISENLDILADAMTVGSARLLATNLIKILASSQPRVPIDTGQLRESGNARVLLGGRRGLVVARGNKSGRVQAMIDKIRYSHVKTARSKINGVIEYKRMRDYFDVALWTHEDLHPHGSMSPAARTPYTGPKYLESAWNEHKGDFMSDLKGFTSDSNMIRIVKQLSRKSTPKTGRYMVDRVQLVRDRIDRIGYYGGLSYKW